LPTPARVPASSPACSWITAALSTPSSPTPPCAPPPRRRSPPTTAAQAFHWFDARAARREFARILRPGGFVVLVYNSWRETDDPFAAAYEALVRRFDPERGQSAATPDATEHGLTALYPGGYGQAELPNPHWYGWETFRGRVLSSSYTPLPEHPDHPAFLQALHELFAAHEQQGRILFPYLTQLYWGRLG
jgi:hypothetical protein